jgi:hypothetical protein
MDGEGCISIHKASNRKAFGIRVAVQMAEPGFPALIALQQTYGGYLNGRPESARCKARQTWILTSRADVMQFLSAVRPWLIVKAPQAELALSWLSLLVGTLRKKNGNVDWTPEIVALGGRLKAEMHRLNERGPATGRVADHDLLTLLPTPRASESEARQTRRTPSQEAGTHGKSLAAEIALLRTPTSAPWNQGGCGGEPEAEIKRLLPTPRANIAKQGLPREGNWGELRADIMSLLPTPSATEYGNNQSPSPGAAVRPSLPSLLIGASMSPPSDDGSRFTDLRLSPSFVEWMIGAPAGWSDPDCRLSAMEFRSSSASSPGNT